MSTLASSGGNGSQPPQGTGGSAGLNASSGGTSAGPPPTTIRAGACEVALPARRLRRLANAQMEQAIADLLGPASRPSITAGARSTRPLFDDPDAPVSTSLLAQLHSESERIGGEIANGKFTSLTGCNETALIDTCVSGFIARLGERAFRRPLSALELQELSAVFNEGGMDGAGAALELLLRAVFTAPSFVWVTEFGTQVPGSNRAELTPHEVAAQLGLSLLDSVPDDALLAAAESGALSTEVGLRAQVDRLLSEPVVQAGLTAVFRRAFMLEDIAIAEKDQAKYPEFGSVLRSAFAEEARLFIEHQVWGSSGTPTSLLTTQSSFGNQALADFYGASRNGPAEAFVPMQLPAERSGLLTLGSVLAARATAVDTSVVRRGLFVRRALACLDEVPSPSPALAGQIATQTANYTTERDRAAARASSSTCGPCHTTFDGFGLVLEGFDSIGRFRRAEQQPVPLAFGGALTADFTGAPDLAQRLASGGRFASCVSRELLSYLVAAPATSACEAPATEASLADTLRTLLASNAMRERSLGGSQ
ncbi:MAG: DUF1592 domain-containing protein [Polyangiaceae bacterium]|nr:DUF1592 domain-containing protein [Polyangiaceae bacterium]